MNWFIFFIVIIGLYFIWTNNQNNRINESFTSADVELANKIIEFLKSPNTYISYVNFLIANKNTSVNLARIATYKELVAKGDALTTADILAQI